MRKTTMSAYAVLAAGGLFALACGAKEPPPPAQPAAPTDLAPAAVVEGADFVANLDFQAIRTTPACKDFAEEAAEKKAEEATSKKDEKHGKNDLKFEEFARITGLKAEDMRAIVVSADVDSMDLDAESSADRMKNASLAIGVQLAKTITPVKLTEALQAAAAGQDPSPVHEIQAAGRPAVHLQSADPKDPDMFVAAGPGDRTIFASGSQAGLEAALQRAASGKFVELPAALKSVRDTLPAGAQIKLAFLAPAKMQEGIKEQLDKAQKDPKAAMWSGMVAPFKDLKSLGLGVECGAALTVGLGADLGTDQAASQLAGMLQGMVLPMMQGGLAEKLKKTPAEVADRFEVSAQGPALKIQVHLTADDVSTLNAAKDEKEPAAAGK